MKSGAGFFELSDTCRHKTDCGRCDIQPGAACLECRCPLGIGYSLMWWHNAPRRGSRITTKRGGEEKDGRR